MYKILLLNFLWKGLRGAEGLEEENTTTKIKGD